MFKSRMSLVLLVLMLGLSGPLFSAEGDYRQVEHTRLFVLGTPHLSSLKDGFRPELLDGLIDRLVTLAPDAILVEALPGPSIVSTLRGHLGLSNHRSTQPDNPDNDCQEDRQA